MSAPLTAPAAFRPAANPQAKMFERKEVPKLKLLPLAAAYVGYIVLCNLNLNINPVGFYQITKIAGEGLGGGWRQRMGRAPCRRRACVPVRSAATHEEPPR